MAKYSSMSNCCTVQISLNEIDKLKIVQLDGLTMRQWYDKQADKPNYMINASLWDNKGAIGTIWEDGKLVRNEGNGFGFGITKTGGIGFGTPWDLEWQDYITGYPALVKDGKVTTDSVDSYVMKSSTKRSVIASAGNNIYLITVNGMTVEQLKKFLAESGYYYAINLDGGGSSRLMVGENAVNSPTDNRKIPNAIAVWLKDNVDNTGNEGNVIPMGKLKIAIDAGHGLYTDGKRCLKSLDPNETREWTLNSRIATYVVEHLQRCGFDTIRVDDITGKTDVALSTRTTTANKNDCDAYVSIHHDSGVGGSSGGGATVFTYTTCSSTSKTLQKNVYDEFIASVGKFGNRSEPLRVENFHVLRETVMPAILIECGFMDSSVDVPLILSDDFARKASVGIAKGVCKTFNVTYAEEKIESEDNDMNTNTPAEWAKEAWEKANSKVGIDGKPIMDGTRPTDTLTRQEFAVVLNRLGLLD